MIDTGTIIGSTFGVSKATIGIMRHQLHLENSPVALESRYQLWKINPSHQWLSVFEDDVRRWNEMEHYGTASVDASIDQNKVNRHISKHLKRYEDKYEEDVDDADGDFEHIQVQKRQRF